MSRTPRSRKPFSILRQSVVVGEAVAVIFFFRRLRSYRGLGRCREVGSTDFQEGVGEVVSLSILRTLEKAIESCEVKVRPSFLTWRASSVSGLCGVLRRQFHQWQAAIHHGVVGVCESSDDVRLVRPHCRPPSRKPRLSALGPGTPFQRADRPCTLKQAMGNSKAFLH
jgi:hypothetical protein